MSFFIFFFLGQLVCHWTSPGTQLSPVAPRSCHHTLGTSFGELAKAGEGSRRVSNPHWVRIGLRQPYCMWSLTPSRTSRIAHLKIQWLWRQWQQVPLECLEQDVAPKEVLVIHCNLAVSRHNGSPSHWIKISQAEESGIATVHRSSHYKTFTHRLVLQFITDYRSLYAHLQVLRRWAHGKSIRCRWTLAVVVTNLHIGGPWVSGRSFSWIQGQQESSAALVGD